MIPLLYKF